MSAIASAPILCGGCDRKFAWKPQLAGRRVKCKCGHVIAVHSGTGAVERSRPSSPAATSAKPVSVKPRPPVRPAPVDDLDGLAALAADAERAAAALPVEIREVEPVAIAVATPAPRRSAGTAPLAYQRAPTAVERQKAAAAARALLDPVRDLYVPTTLVAVGLALYVGFYGFAFNLGAGALAIVAVILAIVIAVKTAMLIGAALFLAGPLGVSFGTLWTAVLKLAAIAVFTDGVTAWVDHGITHLAGHHGSSGMLGYGAMSWAVSVGLYWVMMVYLFAMDVTDARMVVLCLSIFSRVIRFAILMCLMNANGSFSPSVGGSSTAAPTASPAAPMVRISPLSDHVANLKAAGDLVEAREYIAQGHQASLAKTVDGWYAVGCPTVWFEMSDRDINGRRSPQGLVVQLPGHLAGRRKAYEVLKRYDAEMHLSGLPSQMRDTGESYLQAGVR